MRLQVSRLVAKGPENSRQLAYIEAQVRGCPVRLVARAAPQPRILLIRDLNGRAPQRLARSARFFLFTSDALKISASRGSHRKTVRACRVPAFSMPVDPALPCV